MDKSRLLSMSDGVFAVAMTLLVFNIHLPASITHASNPELWYLLGRLWPNFIAYAFSFLVLSVFWINHHYLFNLFVKDIDRGLNLLNMIYLLFLAFVPFSAQLISTFPYNQPASLVYGFNILAVSIMSATMFRYARRHSELSHDIPARTIKQAKIRTSLNILSYIIGIGLSFVYIPVCIFFYLFPIIFNILPGTLDIAERVFGFELA